MIRLRLFAHQERTPEWIVATGTALWGANALADSFMAVARHTMDSPFFAPLTYWMGQTAWGVFALVVGVARIACLVVNGSRPRGSTTFRAIGAGLSALFWTGLVSGAFSLGWNSGAVWTYGMLLTFDLTSLYRAARETVPAFRGALAHGRA